MAKRNHDTRMTQKKLEAGARAQAKRAAAAEKAAETVGDKPAGKPKPKPRRGDPARFDSRSLVSLVLRRMGKRAGLKRTLDGLSVSAPNALEELWRLCALELMSLTEAERMFRAAVEGAVEEGTLTLDEGVKISQELRSFSTNRNRALQTALHVRKQFADENVGDGDGDVHFGMDDVQIAPPTMAPPPEYAPKAPKA